MALTAFDARELEKFTREFEELFGAGEAEAMTSYYAGEARLMAEGMEPDPGPRGDRAILARGHRAGRGGPGPAQHPAAGVVILR
jgi:hypothetical protein